MEFLGPTSGLITQVKKTEVQHFILITFNVGTHYCQRLTIILKDDLPAL